MPPIHRRLRLLTLAALLALGGCNSFGGAPPSSSPDLTQAGDTWTKQFGTDAIVQCLNPGPTPAEPAEQCRNRIVQMRMITIDTNYTSFRQKFYREARTGGFAATVAGLALNTVGAIGGVTSATKSVLSGAAAAISGGREAFDKEILIEQTATALERAMDGARAKVIARIIPSLGKSAAEYPLMVALNDLEAYYNAGTLLGGLMELSEAVTKKADDAEAKVAVYRGLNTTPAANYLVNFMAKPTMAERVEALKKINLAIIKHAPPNSYDGDPVGWMSSRSTDPSLVSKVARELGWTGTN